MVLEASLGVGVLEGPQPLHQEAIVQKQAKDVSEWVLGTNFVHTFGTA